ncbi:hypothetical protein [Paludisphaera rhizosphaerae]|uniref:hypothetical protein n=1 Tax=Paludisphaera rhizosphaerae TaxID=2711216 RepID=UPI00389AC38B
MVLDNAAFHASGVVRAARKALADAGIDLCFLPLYSPEWIEPGRARLSRGEAPRDPGQELHHAIGAQDRRRTGLRQVRPITHRESHKHQRPSAQLKIWCEVPVSLGLAKLLFERFPKFFWTEVSSAILLGSVFSPI